MISDISKTIEWTIRVPIFHNRIIIRQLGIAIGIPFGLLIVFLIVVKAFYALLIIALLLLITYLFILLFWGGKYDVGFKINNSGIHNYTVEKTGKEKLYYQHYNSYSWFVYGLSHSSWGRCFGTVAATCFHKMEQY